MRKLFTSVLKILRSTELWGWRRTYAKLAGRSSIPLWRSPIYRNRERIKDVSVIGCGQAAFATLCYFVSQNRGDCFLDCYDPDAKNAERLRRAYHFVSACSGAEALLQNEQLKTVFIASNHASHVPYAVQALRRDIDTFLEKPLCTTFDGLLRLREAVASSNARLYAGYNRPFSPAVRWLAAKTAHARRPFTLNCTVHGHFLEESHWYRHEMEGTRINGNMAHWIDLAVHLCYCRDLVPNQFEITLAGPGDARPKDDNILVTLITDAGDLVSISLNARHEPFEGIREVIEYQNEKLAVQIDDFRSLRWWSGKRRGGIRYRRKDVGHEACALQPFSKSPVQRSWSELELSSALILKTAELASAGGGTVVFNTATLDLAT